MNTNNSTMRERMIEYWRKLIINSVSQKKHIYDTLKEFMPYVDVIVSSIDDTKDEVTIRFTKTYEEKFIFNWVDHTDSRYPDFKKYWLKSVE